MPATVYFATNRLPNGQRIDFNSYGSDITAPSDPASLTYGRAIVEGTNLQSDEQGRITSIPDVNVGAWSSAAAGDLAQAGRNLLIFVHGFANSFEDSITRAAFNQAWFAQSQVTGAETTVIAFSWPSLGETLSFPILQLAYLRDQRKARLSSSYIVTFLSGLQPILRSAHDAGRRTILLAHSMGCLALESAVESWFAHGNGAAPLFDVSVLAAGDCGANTFGQPDLARLSGLKELSSRIAIYYSHSDAVLLASQVVNVGAQRLGQDGPRNRSDANEFPPGVYRMVDASSAQDYTFDPTSSHQYYRRSPRIRAHIAAEMAGTGDAVV